MKTAATIIVLLGILLIPEYIQAQGRVKYRPQFVRDQMAAYKECRHGFAFADFHAWGIGEKSDRTKFIWFSFTNSDAYYQVVLSEALTPEEVEKISSIKDGFDRPWDTSGGWIGTSNDWFDAAISPEVTVAGKNGRDTYNKVAVTKKYARILKGVFKKFEVKEYL